MKYIAALDWKFKYDDGEYWGDDPTIFKSNVNQNDFYNENYILNELSKYAKLLKGEVTLLNNSMTKIEPSDCVKFNSISNLLDYYFILIETNKDITNVKKVLSDNVVYLHCKNNYTYFLTIDLKSLTEI